ncbi:MAG: hypothetical protein IT350_13830 [Deltaproteobacteria bacterium]|nr:hypothetical protein [Deltaproteobacteria bacterium]
MGFRSLSRERVGAVHRPPINKALSEHALRVKPRRFHCPVSGERDLMGFSHEERPTVFVFDRFFFTWVEHPFYFQHNEKRVEHGYGGFFEIYLGTTSALCVESIEFFNQGKVHLPTNVMEFYKARGGAGPVISPTLKDLFYQAISGRVSTFALEDWLHELRYDDILTLTGWTKFGNRPELFPRLIAVHVKTYEMGMDHRHFIQTEKELLDAVPGGLVGMLAALSCRVPAALELILAAKIYELMHRLCALASIDTPAWRPGRDPLRTAYAFLREQQTKGSEIGELDRLTLAELMFEGLRLGSVSESNVTNLLAWGIAFTASELLVETTHPDPAKSAQAANSVHSNIEIPLYINLLLRDMMQLGEARCRKIREVVRQQLQDALRSMPVYVAAEPVSRRGHTQLIPAVLLQNARNYLDLPV